jgi:hypothetical protein
MHLAGTVIQNNSDGVSGAASLHSFNFTMPQSTLSTSSIAFLGFSPSSWMAINGHNAKRKAGFDNITERNESSASFSTLVSSSSETGKPSHVNQLPFGNRMKQKKEWSTISSNLPLTPETPPWRVHNNVNLESLLGTVGGVSSLPIELKFTNATLTQHHARVHSRVDKFLATLTIVLQE